MQLKISTNLKKENSNNFKTHIEQGQRVHRDGHIKESAVIDTEAGTFSF